MSPARAGLGVNLNNVTAPFNDGSNAPNALVWNPPPASAFSQSGLER